MTQTLTARLRPALSLEGALRSGAALVVIYAGLLVAFTIASPVFLTGDNLLNITASVATLGIVAAVQTAVIISGGFDLSVGSTAAFTSVVVAELLSAGAGAPLAIAGALVVGAVVGLGNALVITKLNVNPLIATLGMMSIVRGAGLVWTDALTVVYPADQLAYLGRARIGGVQVSIVFMLLAFVAVWAVLRYTVFGRFVFAVGGNPKAAFLAGVRVDRVRSIVYVASGLAAGLAGLVIASQLIAGSPQAAQGLELSAVTAAVLGGASLSGGQGRVWMTLVGALIMGTLTNGLVLMDISSFWQMAVLGVVLILAVALDQLRTRARH
ncbi:ABC transporter permease [Phytohabitans aurantiacus]|uniref:Sugar ABC transporter permease n=1 Tax=Phytohabitans aurantiacus TaxID=3016789 RepID=A0ABQ5QPT2_9ACTN|nr:ABC transporter permease [Phytohabitans aurantiacus]GLH96653.1 sugar ABC transporter permease [Phytohabitans aurantiacus]